MALDVEAWSLEKRFGRKILDSSEYRAGLLVCIKPLESLSPFKKSTEMYKDKEIVMHV